MITKTRSLSDKRLWRGHFWFHYIIILSVNLSSIVLAALWLLYAEIVQQEDYFYRPAFEMYRVVHNRIDQGQISQALLQSLGEFEGFRLAIIDNDQRIQQVAKLQFVQQYDDVSLYYMPGGGGYYSTWPLTEGGLQLVIADQYEPDDSLLGHLIDFIKKEDSYNHYAADVANEINHWQWRYHAVNQTQLIEQFPFTPQYGSNLAAATVWVMMINLLIVGLFLSKMIHSLIRSQRELHRVVKHWAKGQLEYRIENTTSMSMQPVVTALNQMAEHLSALMAEQFVMVHAISHELSTPIHKMQLGLGLLEFQLGGEARAAQLTNDLQRYLADMEQLTSTILGFAKLSTLDTLECKDDIQITSLITQRISFITALFVDIHIEFDSSQPKMLVSNYFYLQLALDNVLKNACKYAESQVFVKLHEADGMLKITIEDDGEGLAEQQREAVMSAFVQSDNAHGMAGFGLGLAIVSVVMSKLAGSMYLGEGENKGLLVCLTLPLEDNNSSVFR